MIFAKRRFTGIRREKQISAFMQIDRRSLAIDGEDSANSAEKIYAEQGHLNR